MYIYEQYLYTDDKFYEYDNMKRKNEKSNQKFYEIGRKMGLNDIEIYKAKKTMKNMLGIMIMAGIVIILGKYIMDQLNAVGLWYIGACLKDFNIFSRF